MLLGNYPLFSTARLCEFGFSRQVMATNKYRNKVDAETDLRLQLSSTIRDLSFECPSQQPHPSV
jgi:hypothetical protein